MLSMNQAVYIPSGDPEAGSFLTLGQSGQLGHKVELNVGTPGAPLWVTYRLVKAKTAITFAVGELLWWDDRDDYIVTNVATAAGLVAGVVPAGGNPASTVGVVAPNAGEYFCMIINGRRCVKYVDAPTVAPDALGKLAVASATNGRADCITVAGSLVHLIIGRTAGAQNGTTRLALTDVNIFDQA